MTPNPRHWARELWQRSRDRGLQTHIDVLVDATGLDDYPLLTEHARQSDPPALFKLLEQTRRPPWPARAHCCCAWKTATRAGWTNCSNASTAAAT